METRRTIRLFPPTQDSVQDLVVPGEWTTHPRKSRRASRRRMEASLQRWLSYLMGTLVLSCSPKQRPTLEKVPAPKNGSASLLDPWPNCLHTLPFVPDAGWFCPPQGNCLIWSSLWPITLPWCQLQSLAMWLNHIPHRCDRVTVTW